MYCPNCGTELAPGAMECTGCGWFEVTPQATSVLDDPAMRMVLPVGRSPMAIVAGYFGLVSVLFFPAPFALGFGIWALIDIKKHPKKSGKGRAIFGIVMGGIFTALLMFFFLAMFISA